MILKSLLQAISRETDLGSGLLFRHREAMTADAVPSSHAIKHRRKVQGVQEMSSSGWLFA